MSLVDVLSRFWDWRIEQEPTTDSMVDEFIENAQIQLPVVNGPYLHQLTKKLRNKGLLTTCLDCVHYKRGTGCGNCLGECEVWGGKPPLNFIVTGCEEWSPPEA